jgi:hypothetical protein
MRLALIFDKRRPDTTGGYFERACAALGVAADHFWLREASRVPAAYDLYLRIDHGDDYDAALPAALRPAAFYAIDTHLPRTWRKIRRLAATFDRVFCAQAAAARRLPNAAWLPLAADLELHAGPARARDWDVAFVGTDGGTPRKFYLQALRERYPSGWIGAAPHTQLGPLYGRAKIGFNYAIAEDVNMRVFEVLAAGALLVTNALAHDDLARLGLVERRHLVCYRRPEELFPLIDHYLEHPTEREAVARAGAEAVRAGHTYAHRLRQLLLACGFPWPAASGPLAAAAGAR